jgi:hypothetical protein
MLDPTWGPRRDDALPAFQPPPLHAESRKETSQLPLGRLRRRGKRKKERGKRKREEERDKLTTWADVVSVF